jgi:hypothetical protein
MRSNLHYAVLAARAGSRSRRSLERLWQALSPLERAQVDDDVDALAARGVRAALSGDAAPLFHTGPFESVGPRVVAVCAPVEARGGATRLAIRAAEVAVAAGATVLTGDTDGPEAAAVRAALAGGGVAVRVLAEGMPHRSPAEPRLVTVTPCAPGRAWSVETAMDRNATIAGMCSVLVAIGAAGSGATLDAGMQALDAGRPVLAVGSTAGSRLLVDYGATAAVDEIELAWWLDTRLPSERPAQRLTGNGGIRTERIRGCDTVIRQPAVWHRPVRQWSTA